jgi:hypothetical protein
MATLPTNLAALQISARDFEVTEGETIVAPSVHLCFLKKSFLVLVGELISDVGR